MACYSRTRMSDPLPPAWKTLIRDPELRARMGQRGRATAEKHRWQVVARSSGRVLRGLPPGGTWRGWEEKQFRGALRSYFEEPGATPVQGLGLFSQRNHPARLRGLRGFQATWWRPAGWSGVVWYSWPVES